MGRQLGTWIYIVVLHLEGTLVSELISISRNWLTLERVAPLASAGAELSKHLNMKNKRDANTDCATFCF
jgi:hypothetical protein